MHPFFSVAVVISDFNTDFNFSTHDSKFVLDFSSSNHLHIVQYTDTYHTSSFHSRINHCLVSNAGFIKSWDQQAAPFLSNHNLIEIMLDLPVNRSRPRLIKVRDLSRFDLDGFYNFLLSHDWLASIALEDLDQKVEEFYLFLNSLVKSYLPYKIIITNKPPALWLDQPIRALLRRRDAARRVYLPRPSSERSELFRELRNEAKLRIKDARNRYLQGRLGSCVSRKALI